MYQALPPIFRFLCGQRSYACTRGESLGTRLTLASSWKNLLNLTLVLCGTVLWVQISCFASQPQKPQKFYPSPPPPPPRTHYMVVSAPDLPMNTGIMYKKEEGCVITINAYMHMYTASCQLEHPTSHTKICP